MNWIPYGPNAWLLEIAHELGDDAFYRVRSVVANLERHPPAGLVEYVVGFTTVLLEFSRDQTDVETAVLPELKARIQFDTLAKISPHPVKTVPVQYNGPDLDRVAAFHQVTPEEVAAVHSGTLYRVYLLGFSPGFPYLGDLDSRLHTPRLASPRTRVPPGSVAIGGAHTGIYTIPSAGGWNSPM